MRRAWAMAGLALVMLPGAVVAQADSAPAPSAYTYAALRHLDCYRIDKKIEEGKAAGDPDASYTAAQLVARSICFKYDPKAYAKLLSRAVESGHRDATLDLAYAHALGEGVDQDYQRAGELVLRLRGSQLQPETDAYTLGYAWAFGRLARRYSTELLDLKTPKHPHDMLVEVVADPTGTNRYSVERKEPAPPELAAEAQDVSERVDQALKGAVSAAGWSMPKRDGSRLKAQPLRTRWILAIGPREEALPADKIETYRPR